MEAAQALPAECDIDTPPEHCLFHDGFTGTRCGWRRLPPGRRRISLLVSSEPMLLFHLMTASQLVWESYWTMDITSSVSLTDGSGLSQVLLRRDRWKGRE